MNDRPTLGAWLLRLLGLAILGLALSAMAFRAPDRSLESLVARWAPAPSDFVEVPLGDGLTQLVHLRDQGPRDDAQPLVLLHGLAGSLHGWEAWVAELSPQRRVISLDLPGFGLTGPAALGDYSDQAYGRFLQALFTQLGLRRFILVGHSLGGQLAWQYAAQHPEQVASLVLLDAGGLALPVHWPATFQLMRWPVLGAVTDSLLPRPVVAATLREVFADPSRVRAAVVDRYFELALREGNRPALRQRLAQQQAGYLTEQLGQIQAPTLILWGEQDRILPPAHGQALQRAIPHSQLALLPGLGHAPQEEDPVSTVRRVQTFLHSLKP